MGVGEGEVGEGEGAPKDVLGSLALPEKARADAATSSASSALWKGDALCVCVGCAGDRHVYMCVCV